MLQLFTYPLHFLFWSEIFSVPFVYYDITNQLAKELDGGYFFRD